MLATSLRTRLCARSIRGAALALGLIALLPLRALAGGGPTAEPLTPGTLHAGDRVTLRCLDLPSSADEFEVLLSIDGGRRFPIRVSPELDPRSGTLTWHVPALAAEEACLRVRYSVGGREQLGAVSAKFRIEPATDPNAASLAGASAPVVEGDWWAGPEPLPPGSSSSLTPQRSSLTADTGEANAPLGPRAPSAPSRPRALSVSISDPIPSPPSAASVADPAPRFTPLRN